LQKKISLTLFIDGGKYVIAREKLIKRIVINRLDRNDNSRAQYFIIINQHKNQNHKQQNAALTATPKDIAVVAVALEVSTEASSLEPEGASEPETLFSGLLDGAGAGEAAAPKISNGSSTLST
jgi:hypothetical protein